MFYWKYIYYKKSEPISVLNGCVEGDTLSRWKWQISKDLLLDGAFRNFLLCEPNLVTIQVTKSIIITVFIRLTALGAY